jgi:hypothetical protein
MFVWLRPVSVHLTCLCAVCRFAIGMIEDSSLVEELLSYILTKARDQDIVSYCFRLSDNPVSRRRLATFFKDNYDDVSMLSYSLLPMFTRYTVQQAICNQLDVEISRGSACGGAFHVLIFLCCLGMFRWAYNAEGLR